jgi:lactate dehydrogenase-like 2-hydroxyacid dehydrogenase
MINDELMKEMKDGVCIVNTSRGEIIDHQALLK